jgi:predicted SprT family Zn-dependent metalloprotease
MNPYDARTMAWELMQRHGLAGWTFRFDSARRRFGSCQAAGKAITLSRPLTLLNTIDQVRDTILHEIAHALTPGDGHGPRWRAMCAKIGASPKRCYDDRTVVSPPRRPARYRYGCRGCGFWVDRRRLTDIRRYVCAACRGPLVYQEKSTGRFFRIAATRAGRMVLAD